MTSTLFNNALHFDGTGGAHLKRTNTAVDHSPLSRTFSQPSSVTDGRTGNNSQPWASSIIFNIESINATNNSILWRKRGGGVDHITLKLDTSGKLVFTLGRLGAGNYIKFTSADSLATDQWHAIYIDYNGGRTRETDSYGSRFRIKGINLSNGNTTDLATTGTWEAFGNGSRNNVTGSLILGANSSGNNNFSGDIAAFGISTLKKNAALPDDTEVDKFVRDPKTWLSDYKLGNKFRYPSQKFNQTHTNFTMDSSGAATTASSQATQIYLFGDGMPIGGVRSDSYSDMKIRNRVYPGYSNVELINASSTNFSSGSFTSIYTPLSPSITSVSSTTANGTYGIGDSITIDAVFSAAVNVVTTGGSPTLELETGDTDRTASYSSGTGTTTLSFTYTVQEGDNTNDLDSTGTSALALNGGTTKASTGAANNANLTLASPGAANSLGDNKALVIDGGRPTIAITDDDADNSLSTGDTSTLTFTLSEASIDFVEADISVSGGSLSNWTAGSSTSYTATFTPDTNSTTDGVISVANSKFSDSAGNTNDDGSDANNSQTFTVDTVRPTIAMTSDVASLKAGETAALTFTLSEASTDFVEADVSISGGTLSNFSGSGTSYSATFTPTADSTTDGIISVASSKFTDSAGNTNADGSDANNSITLSVNTIRSTSSSTSSDSGSNTAPSYLLLNEDNSFFVTEGSSLGTWVNLDVTLADADLQNSLIIVDQNANVLGAIGSTGLSQNLGNHSIFVPQGSTIRFHQISGDQPLQESLQLSIFDQNDGTYLLQLNDSLDDNDYNDLCIEVSYSSSSPAPTATTMATEQLEINDAILDLSSIPLSGQSLRLEVKRDADWINHFALVKLQKESDEIFLVDGLSNSDGDLFDEIVRENLFYPGEEIISAPGESHEQYDWFISVEDAGFYAPVLITQEDEVITYGSTQVKNLGCNFFAFEDNGLSRSSDWDYNDLTVLFEAI